ncbi:MAG: AMP-binding protein [Planctomycetales bacterium]|nr:AMP-binding protein [Planctomycetales bacterium]
MTRPPPTIVEGLRHAATVRGSKVAFRHGARSLTFRDLLAEGRGAAAALVRRGLRPGEVAAVACGDPLARIVAHVGVLLAGGVALPLNPDYREELATILPDSGAGVLVADAPLAERALAVRSPTLRAVFSTGPVGTGGADGPAGTVPWDEARASASPVPERRPLPEDAALLVYTSGTTGPPKGVPHTHASLVANLEALRVAWAWTPSDVLFLPVVLFHVHGLQNGVHGTILTACTTVIPGRFDAPGALATLDREGCTMMFGVPTHYHRLLEAAAAAGGARPALPALRLFVSGSAPLPPGTFERFRVAFGHEILERYGMTETLMIASNPLAGPRRPGAVGRALPGVQVRVDAPAGEPGEVLVRGPSVFPGYRNRPQANAAAFHEGWFRTGDIGTLDPDGTLRLVGRATETINTGGLKVYPREVEAALESHPAVREAAVVAVPDADLGEAVGAAVALREGAAADEAAIVAYARERLAGYKKPRRFAILPALPRNAVGKVDKSAVRRALTGGG